MGAGEGRGGKGEIQLGLGAGVLGVRSVANKAETALTTERLARRVSGSGYGET